MLLNFLKSNDIRKLKVFLILYDQEYITLKLLADRLGENPATTKRLLNALNSDLSIFTHAKDQLITIQQNELVSVDHSQNYSVEELLSTLYHRYLEDSVEYKIFSNIIIGNITNVLELCVKINISQSYCYSKIKKINTYLADYRVSLEIDTFNIILKGTETDCQFFLLLTYNSFPLFKKSNSDTHLKQASLFNKNIIDNQSEARLKNLLQVYFKRKKFSKDIRLENEKFKELLKIISQINNVISDNSVVKTDETITLFYNLLTRIAIPTIDTCEQKIMIGKVFFESDNSLILPLKKIITECYQTFLVKEQLSESEKADLFYPLMYSLTLHVCYIECFQTNLKALSKNNFKFQVLNFLETEPDELNTHIKTIINNHLSEYNWNKSSLSELSTLLQKNLYTVISSYQQPTINIMVMDLDSTYSAKEIKRRITGFFSTKSINFVEHFSQADLLITDIFTTLTLDIPVFVYYDGNSTDIWQKLLNIIGTLLFTKFI